MILSYFLPSFSSSVRKYVSGSFFLSFSRMHVVADPLPPFLAPSKRKREKGEEEKRTEIDGEERKGGMSPPVRFADVCLYARLNYTISPFLSVQASLQSESREIFQRWTHETRKV